MFGGAFAVCRKKTLKKNFTNDKLLQEEKEQFSNCIAKYVGVSDAAYEGLRAGFIHNL